MAEREGAASEVEEDILETPAHCGLPFPIKVHLRHVLDQGNGRFAVSARSDCGPVLVDLVRREHLDDVKNDHDGELDHEECDDPVVYGWLLSAVVHEDLSQLDRSQQEGMDREENVIDVDLAGVPYIGVDDTLQIVYRIEVKASGVEHGKLYGEACDRFGFVILP